MTCFTLAQSRFSPALIRFLFHINRKVHLFAWTTHSFLTHCTETLHAHVHGMICSNSWKIYLIQYPPRLNLGINRHLVGVYITLQMENILMQFGRLFMLLAF